MSNGKRFNKGKSRMSLIPFSALRAIGDVFSYGERKYEANNWLKGMKWSFMADCMLRHYERFSMGETVDEESGCLHSAHMAWNAIGLLTYELLNLGDDDRWTKKSEFTPLDLQVIKEKTFEELDPDKKDDVD